jgi:hypothetical protein
VAVVQGILLAIGGFWLALGLLLALGGAGFLGFWGAAGYFGVTTVKKLAQSKKD